MSEVLGDRAKGKNKAQQVDELNTTLSEMTQNPELVTQLTNPYAEDLSLLGDELSAAVRGKIGVALNYLQAEIPKPDLPPTPFTNRPYTPSDRQISQFERKLQAVIDPLSVLDEIASGTATIEHMQAIKTVYPDLHSKIKDVAIDIITKKEGQIPEKSRRKLLMLLDDQMLSGYDPRQLANLQANFAPKDKAKPRANSKITEASRGGTDIDRIVYGR
jgi:hypothetical protein